MIRVVLFLLSVSVIAWGFAWVADRPGQVAVTWMGYRVETSVIVAAFAVAAFVLVVMAIWAIVRAILRSPEQVSLFFRHRRAIKGYLAISRGLIAVGAGDLRLARRSADDAARLSPGDPLALLLTAQSAQMAGDSVTAERAFRDMSARDDTKLLGLRGLYIEAQRRNDLNAARLAAEEAAKARPGVVWAGLALLDYRCAAKDWSGALDALDHMKSALEKPDYRRKRAVLLVARAQAIEDIDRDTSRALVLESVKLAPDLVPAAALAGRRLSEAGDVARSCARIHQARARSGAGSGACRTAALGSRRRSQGKKNSGSGLGAQSAPRYRRKLCQHPARRQRARASDAHAKTRREGSGAARGSVGGSACSARCARVCDGAGSARSICVSTDTPRRHADGGN